MKALEEKILREGQILPGNVLKVGSFLNQQIDVPFMNEMASEGVRFFSDKAITKVLTVEASGIAFGYAVAAKLNVPLVFAKKSRTSNVSGSVLQAQVYSYTHNTNYTATVSADFLTEKDTVLLVDDFLANGEALKGLAALAEQGGAQVAGALIAIEKGFQKGGDALRQAGMQVESLAIIEEMSPERGIRFRP
ncbi:MAG: xanthine phosphoribosyltransferase [Clostridia bacterium]|nr:xanthine phosphoribosyltransferase [Clostridia bacterium]